MHNFVPSGHGYASLKFGERCLFHILQIPLFKLLSELIDYDTNFHGSRERSKNTSRNPLVRAGCRNKILTWEQPPKKQYPNQSIFCLS